MKALAAIATVALLVVMFALALVETIVRGSRVLDEIDEDTP